jgi:RNA recognition motif-containing protein
LIEKGFDNIASIFIKINRLFKSPMAFITFNNSDAADKAVNELPKEILFDEKIPYVNYQESALQREKNKKRHLSNKIDGNSRFVYMKNLTPDLTEEKLTKVLNDNGYYVDSVKIKKPDSLVDNSPGENSQPSQMATIKMRNEILG